MMMLSMSPTVEWIHLEWSMNSSSITIQKVIVFLFNMAYCPSVFSPHSENNVESFMNITDEYDPEYELIWFILSRKPNSYLLYCEKREKEEEEAQRVFMVKQQLEEVSVLVD